MLKSLTLYTALALAANAAAAGPEAAALEALRTGDMAPLEVAAAPGDPLDARLAALDGSETALADLRGMPVVLNFWATWCGPCRAEMPSLARLQQAERDRIAVVTVAIGPHSDESIRRFLDEVEAPGLPVLLDPRMALSADLGVESLPVTVLLDAEGREVARLSGAAEWDMPEAKAILDALISK